MAACLLVITVISVPALAQDCKIRRFGGPNRFSDPVESVAALQAMFDRNWGDIEGQLTALGWSGDPDDLKAAVSAGKVSMQDFPAKTHFDWMLLRKGGRPTAVSNQCWAGPKSFPGFAVDVESNGRLWHFAVPTVCGNLALLGSDAMPEKPETSRLTPAPPPPAPPPPPKPAPPPAPPAPPPSQAAAPAPAPAPATPVKMINKCNWTARLFGAWVSSSDKELEILNGGNPNETRTQIEVNDGWAAGVEGECRFRPRLGVPVTLLYTQNELFLIHDSLTTWSRDTGDLDGFGLTLGLNYYFTDPGDKVDFYIGPFIGVMDYRDSSLSAPPLEAEFDDTPFVWGAQLGVDVPAGKGWGFHAGLRYFDVNLDFDGTGLDLDIDPIMVTVGGAYHF